MNLSALQFAMKSLNQLRKDASFVVWRNIHALPAGLIRIWQDLMFARIARHTYRSIPMYRELWEEVGVREKDLRGAYAARKLPIVDKSVFRRFPERKYLYPGLPPALYSWTESSGSTGEHFRFVSSAYEPGAIPNRYGNFLRYKFLRYAGEKFDGSLDGIKIVFVRVGDIRPQPSHMFLGIRSFYEDPRGAFAAIRDFGADIIESYAGILVELARISAKSGGITGKLRFRYAVSFGELLTDTQRKFIESAFDCEVFDRYALKECQIVGTECRRHDGQHENSEAVFVEIVDDRGNALPAGRSGRIIVTHFANLVMPFIRYDSGDRGHFIEEACSCGIKTPRFRVEGREGQFLDLGGTRIHYREFYPVFRKKIGAVLQHQVKKISNERLEILIIPGENYDEKAGEEIRSGIRSLAGKGVSVDIKCVDFIERAPSGKCQTVVDVSN